jgi:hypothetical protein
MKRMLAIAGVVTVAGAGAAFATHVTQVDPATVPTGFLAAHNEVEGIRIVSLAQAVDDGEADVFVQHVRFTANQDTGWHSHPGPVFVQVVKGSLIYEDALRGKCRRITYTAGQGFFDRASATCTTLSPDPRGRSSTRSTCYRPAPRPMSPPPRRQPSASPLLPATMTTTGRGGRRRRGG